MCDRAVVAATVVEAEGLVCGSYFEDTCVGVDPGCTVREKRRCQGFDEPGETSANGYQIEHVKLAICWPRAARFIGGTISPFRKILKLFGVRSVSRIGGSAMVGPETLVVWSLVECEDTRVDREGERKVKDKEKA